MLLNWTGTCTSTDKVSFTLSYSLYLYQCDSSIHILEAVFPSATFEAFMFCWYAIGKSNQLHIFKSSDFRLGLSCIMFKKVGCFKLWFRQSENFLLQKGNFVVEGNSVVESKSLLLQIQLNDGFICKSKLADIALGDGKDHVLN